MKVKAEIKGMDSILKNMNTYSAQMDIGIQDAMEQVIEYIVDIAQSRAPQDTGALRNSIRGVVREITKDVYSGHIEAAIYYASFIEFGTIHMKAQPFLEPAIEEGIRRMTAEIQRAHERAGQRMRKTNIK